MSNVDRRTFLASAGAGAAALALGNGARAAGPNDRLRVAVVGIRGGARATSMPSEAQGDHRRRAL